jgi:ubiquinone/menaquinone biosynthesis C-methylase UbiE
MPGEYTIAGGLADAQRLARQAQVMASATSAFLAGVGLTSGSACLDVGCGDGQVTIVMGRVVGPSGRAVGIDVDAEALAIAREAAMRAGVRADFVQADAVRPIDIGAFDLVYARLLLSLDSRSDNWGEVSAGWEAEA